MRLKEYLRQLKDEVEKDGHQKSEKWKLYTELFKLQSLENEYPVRISIVEVKKQV